MWHQSNTMFAEGVKYLCLTIINFKQFAAKQRNKIKQQNVNQPDTERNILLIDERQGDQHMQKNRQKIICHNAEHTSNHAHTNILGCGISVCNQSINTNCR